MSLKHVSFLTRDLTAVLAFYTRLGGEVEKDVVTHEGYRRGVVRLGEGRVQFFEIMGEASAPHPHWAEHLALYVPDVRATLAELRSGGAEITRELQASPGGRDMAFVRDPDGRQVELLGPDRAEAIIRPLTPDML